MKKVVTTVFCLLTLLFFNQPYIAESNQKSDMSQKELLYHDMFITLIHSDIQQKINDYYSAYLTRNPTVWPYQVNIIDAERVNEGRTFKFEVTVEVLPSVGPHISVGKDQLTFVIDHNVQLIKFEHIETYQLPKHWQHIIKKRN